jgi:hypothetical protein
VCYTGTCGDFNDTLLDICDTHDECVIIDGTCNNLIAVREECEQMSDDICESNTLCVVINNSCSFDVCRQFSIEECSNHTDNDCVSDTVKCHTGGCTDFNGLLFDKCLLHTECVIIDDKCYDELPDEPPDELPDEDLCQLTSVDQCNSIFGCSVLNGVLVLLILLFLLGKCSIHPCPGRFLANVDGMCPS